MVGGAPCPVEVMVAGVPDERSGEELVAWLRLRPRVVREADAARELFRSRVARFEIPRYVLFADRVPDVGHRQAAEVQAARAVDHAPGSGLGVGPT
jgi:acyl-CoA synthetase (AMP-forming)/AMP-acid ligase II